MPGGLSAKSDNATIALESIYTIDANFGGALTLNLGGQQSQVMFSVGSAAQGNMTTDTVDGANDLSMLLGTVAGSLTFNLGYGNDTVTVFNAPAC
jgi:hypothetical protein